MSERYQLPWSCVPPTRRRKGGGYPPSGGLEDGKTRRIREEEDMVAFRKGSPPFLKATLPTCAPRRRGLSLLQHAPRPSPATRGLGPACHENQLRAEEAKPPRVVRTTVQRLQATPHFRPDQRAEGAGSHAGGMQPRQVGALLRLPTRPAWRPRPTCHATGAPNAACMQLHRHLRHYRASSTAEPISRLEATLRVTQQCQPSTTVKCGQNWAGSNGGGRRAGAAVTSSAKLMSHPGAAREPSLTA